MHGRSRLDRWCCCGQGEVRGTMRKNTWVLGKGGGGREERIDQMLVKEVE